MKYCEISISNVFYFKGPVGLALGGTAGGLYSYNKSKGMLHFSFSLTLTLCFFVVGQFRSAAEILINDLSNEEKQKLYDHVVQAFIEFQPQDLAYLLPLLTTSVPFQKIVLAKVIHFLTTEMNMQIEE